MENDLELKLTDTLAVYYEVAINDILDKAEKYPHVFSDNFERKMEKLIKKHKKPWYRLVSTPAKKIAAAIILAVVLSFSTAMTIRASREAIIKFFVEIYETFSVVFFGEVDPDTGEPRLASEDNDNSGVITDIYEITYIPEGYELVYKETIGEICIYKYEYRDLTKPSIKFSYVKTENTTMTVINTENSPIYTFGNGEKRYEYILTDEYIQVVWVEDKYVFNLVANDLTEAKNIINSIILIKK